MSCVTLALLATLAGHPTDTPKAPKTITLDGMIRAASGWPAGRARVLLVTKNAEEHELFALDGADRSELEHLAGVRVRVRGHRGDPRLPSDRNVLVEGYEILDVGGGRVPELGTIAELKTPELSRLIFVTEDGQAALLPEAWGKKMTRHVGAKVWMLGDRTDGEMTPTKFAILRARPKDK